ncbi:MAG: PDZ domain-containing protein [Leptospiraceae bacterium]|nr:PDZ domain-containing protein [Leptospiraceae bacterium]MDW7975259.1 PDZ domain-containing protein [Leptospiraceae bacterium]
MMRYFVVVYLLFLFLSACKTGEKLKENTKEEAPVILDNKKKEENEQAYLGILYTEYVYGVQVVEVFPDSPASKAGLEIGDIILSANGYPIFGSYTLKENIFSRKPGTEVIIEVEKMNGKRTKLRAVLEPMPEKYKKYYQNH